MRVEGAEGPRRRRRPSPEGAAAAADVAARRRRALDRALHPSAPPPHPPRPPPGPEGGKPLYCLRSTLQCAAAGCVSCCYKLVVRPRGAEPTAGEPGPGGFPPPPRPEECLRARLRARWSEEGGGGDDPRQDTALLPSLGALGGGVGSAPGRGPRRIVTVGDGDLSFSLAVGRALCRLVRDDEENGGPDNGCGASSSSSSSSDDEDKDNSDGGAGREETMGRRRRRRRRPGRSRDRPSLLATTYLTRSELDCAYGRENVASTLSAIDRLSARGVDAQVLHGVDATRLDGDGCGDGDGAHPGGADPGDGQVGACDAATRRSRAVLLSAALSRADVVCFNFPCVSGGPSGRDAQREDRDANAALVVGFLRSCRVALGRRRTSPPSPDAPSASPDAPSPAPVVVVSHKTKGGFGTWDLPALGARAGTPLLRSVAFDRDAHPGYLNRKAASGANGGARGGRSFPSYDARVYVFDGSGGLDGEAERDGVGGGASDGGAVPVAPPRVLVDEGRAAALARRARGRPLAAVEEAAAAGRPGIRGAWIRAGAAGAGAGAGAGAAGSGDALVALDAGLLDAIEDALRLRPGSVAGGGWGGAGWGRKRPRPRDR